MTDTQKALDALDKIKKWPRDITWDEYSYNWRILQECITQSDPQKIKSETLDQVEREFKEMEAKFRDHKNMHVCEFTTIIGRRIRSLRDQEAEPTSVDDLPSDIVDKLDHAIEQSDKNAKDPEWVNRMAKDIANTPSDYADAPEKVKGGEGRSMTSAPLEASDASIVIDCSAMRWRMLGNDEWHNIAEAPAPSKTDSEGTREPSVRQRNAMKAHRRYQDVVDQWHRRQWEDVRRFIENAEDLIADLDSALDEALKDSTREDGIRECVKVLQQVIKNEFVGGTHDRWVLRGGITSAIKRLSALLDAPSQPELTWEDVPRWSRFWVAEDGRTRFKTDSENYLVGGAWHVDVWSPANGLTILSIDQAEESDENV